MYHHHHLLRIHIVVIFCRTAK